MSIATVRLRMEQGSDVYFRASRKEISRMVLMRHQKKSSGMDQAVHVLTTENNIPITIDLSAVEEIHIS